MQIADGRKDLQQIRDGKAQSVARLRASKSPHYSSEEKDDDEGPSSSLATALPKARSLALGPQASRDDTERLIDALAGSTPAMRNAAVEIVVQGPRQAQFETVTSAVVDLYQRLSRAGR
jgi:hypothetical protein